MATIATLPNWRQESDGTIRVRLKDSGVAADWTGFEEIRAYMYSNAQRVIAGKCSVEIDGEDPTVLVCTYPATAPQYLGVNSIVIRAKYHDRNKTYDKPVAFFVERTADVAGEVVLDDPQVDIEIEVEDVSTSILDAAIAAAVDAAARATVAAEEAEQVVDIHRGPKGDQGDPGPVGPQGPIGLRGPKGETGNQGNTGSSVEFPFTLVNNRTTDDPEAGLTAAEGKRLGDDIAVAREDIGERDVIPGEESIDLGTLSSGGIRASTGAAASSSTSVRTGYLDIAALAGKMLIYSRQKVSGSDPSSGLAFFNASQEYISGQAWIGDSEEEVLERTEISVPANAKYVRFCVRATEEENAYMKYPTETVVYTSGLGKEVTDMREDVDEMGGNIYKDVTTPQAVTSGKVYTLTVGSAPALGDLSTYKCIAVTGLQKGDRVTFHAYAGASYATWGKAKNGIVTYASGKGVEVNTTVECDGTFDAIYVNAYNSYLNPPSASVTVAINAFDYADKLVEDLNIPARKTLNILCFGNSFTQGCMGYVPAMMKRLAPDMDVTIAMAVIGASPLAQHLAYFTDTTQVLSDYTYYINSQTGEYERITNSSGNVSFSGGYTLMESVNGGKWTQVSGNIKIPTILARRKWNIVTLQQRGATDGNDYDTSYAPFIYALQKAIALQVEGNVRLAWIMTHGTYKSSKSQRLADWEDVKNNAREVMDKTGADLLLPYGTAVQNLRTTTLDSLGDYANGGALQVDEGHLQQGVGCLAAAYAIALALLKDTGHGDVGVVGDDLRPDATWLAAIGVNWNIGTGVIGVSDANCVLAQIAATKAVSNPYELTDISVFEE